MAAVTLNNGKYYKDGKLFSGTYTVPGTGQKIVMKNGVPVQAGTPTPSATPSASPAPSASSAQGGSLANLMGGGSVGGAGQYANRLFVSEKAGVMTAADAKASFYKWTDKQLNAFIKTLGSYGIKNVTPAKAEQMWIMAVDGASTWYSKSGGTKQITPEQYIKWNSKPTATTTAPNLPQKQVYLYDKATIQGLIDDTLSSTLGRKATDDENKQFYTAIKAMIDEGTVTTTATKVVNGKKTLVSTTTPGFSQEAAAAAIQEKIKTGTVSQQQDYLQKKSLDFGDFLSQLGG